MELRERIKVPKMLRLASSFVASLALVLLGANLLGAAVKPAPKLKIIATVVAHAHPHPAAAQAPHGL